MAEFVAFHPDNKARGSGLLAALAQLGSEEVEHIFKKYGLRDVHPDEWVPQQTELDILRDISSEHFFLDMVGIGMKIPEVAIFPPEVNEVHQVLATLNDAYRMNVQGPDVGEYHYEKLGDRAAQITVRNPYPSDFDYGLIYGVVKRFRPADSRQITVRRDDSIPNRTTGGDTCVYTAEW